MGFCVFYKQLIFLGIHRVLWALCVYRLVVKHFTSFVLYPGLGFNLLQGVFLTVNKHLNRGKDYRDKNAVAKLISKHNLITNR